MGLDKRGMARREFKEIRASRLCHTHVVFPEFSGETGILCDMRLDASWVIGGRTIADNGYTWLQLAPDSGEWWLTVMYDQRDELVQYYFDITLIHFIGDDGAPGFVDLYLDIVMDRTGACRLLDMDELEAAFDTGEIDDDTLELAIKRARKLLCAVEGHEKEWRELCAKCLAACRELDGK